VIWHVPEEIPVTIPVAGLTLSMDGQALVQVPPGGIPTSGIVLPAVTDAGPVIMGKGLTVITRKALPRPRRK
jgi:hypothetical protein